MAVHDIKLTSRLSKEMYIYLVMFSDLRSLSSRKSACVSVFLARVRKLVAYKAKVSSRCSHYLPAAILEDQGCPPTWRLHIKLYNFAHKIRRISQLWDTAHTLNLERCLLYLSSIMILDFIFYCVTTHTLYRQSFTEISVQVLFQWNDLKSLSPTNAVKICAMNVQNRLL